MDIHRTIANAHDALLQIQQEHAYSTRLKDKKIADQRLYIEELEVERDARNERVLELENNVQDLTSRVARRDATIAWLESVAPHCRTCGVIGHNSRWHWRYH